MHNPSLPPSCHLRFLKSVQMQGGRVPPTVLKSSTEVKGMRTESRHPCAAFSPSMLRISRPEARQMLAGTVLSKQFTKHHKQGVKMLRHKEDRHPRTYI
jgi:hypothetical protein